MKSLKWRQRLMRLISNTNQILNSLKTNMQLSLKMLKSITKIYLMRNLMNCVSKLHKLLVLIDSFKQDIRREFHTKKTHKDTLIQHNILQEIKRFESNMQVKKKDRPLSMSQLQLKPERHSTSNLHKIEELVKVSLFVKWLETGFKDRE